MIEAAAASDPAVRDFVERFQAAWARPTAEGLAAICHPEVRLGQPLMRELRGRAAVAAGFGELLRAMPDLRGDVERWSREGQLVFIELTLSGTLSGRRVSWTVVDRILLEDGLVRERISYFDPLPLVLGSLRAPRSWRRFIRLMRG
jgi:hypothetical protein